MGWLQRMFGMEKPADAQVNPAPQAPTDPAAPAIAPERVGLNGEYDQSGLAKRVALAFDQDPDLDDVPTLWVAQTGGKVVLKGHGISQALLDKAISIAGGVNGATEVDASEVTVG